MFKKITQVSIALLLILALGWGYLLAHVSKQDLIATKQMLKEQETLSSKNMFNTTHQERKDVVKEIWFTQEDGSRLQTRIFSESSLLTIRPEGKNFDLIEKLEKIKCWMQDKLYPSTDSIGPTQQLRFLQAEEGLYRFTSQEFLAQSVDLSLYRLNGHALPDQTQMIHPFLKGIAQDVSFAVSGKNPQFKAQHFKAELNTIEEKK